MTPSLYIVTEETLWRKLQEEFAPGFKLCRNKKKRACDQNKATKTTSSVRNIFTCVDMLNTLTALCSTFVLFHM